MSEETKYAIRRADGALMYGEFAWVGTSGPGDWEAAEADSEGCGAKTYTYEMVRFDPEVVEARSYPRCQECQTFPASYWGLCEKHAREDDPEYFEYQKWLRGEDDE